MPAREAIGPALLAERDERYRRWLAMVSGVRDDVYGLHHHRAIWRQVVEELVRVSPDERVFEEHYTELYVDGQAIALRRLVDRISGRSLLHDFLWRLPRPRRR